MHQLDTVHFLCVLVNANFRVTAEPALAQNLKWSEARFEAITIAFGVGDFIHVDQFNRLEGAQGLTLKKALG